MTPQAIGKYERGEDMPSPRVLAALAAALGCAEERLVADSGIVLRSVDFRREADVGARELSMIGASTVQRLQAYMRIEDLLGLSSVSWRFPPGAPYRSTEPADAERAARCVREEWGLGDAPVRRLAELLEERGVKVLSLDLQGVDGMAASVTRDGHEAARVVVVRREAWSERKRFTLAHELGHIVLDTPAGVDTEKAANRFAGAFLMPADALRAEVGARRSTISIGELVGLKLRFGTSVQAVAYRCRELGIIDRPVFAALFDSFEERGWRRAPFEEPGSLAPDLEEPRRFERLILRALSEGLIDHDVASDMLDVPRAELVRRRDQYPSP